MKRLYFALLAVTLALSFLAIVAEAAQQNLTVQKDESLRRGETRATLDPNIFTHAGAEGVSSCKGYSVGAGQHLLLLQMRRITCIPAQKPSQLLR